MKFRKRRIPKSKSTSPEIQPGEFHDVGLVDDDTALAVAALRNMLPKQMEVFGDEEDNFVTQLRKLKGTLGIQEGVRVLYPGSSAHVGVARVFGKEHVTHVDPDTKAVEALRRSGYIAEAVGIEDYTPQTPAQVMVALNSYGIPTEEVIKKLVAPGGHVIANNWTNWAHDLSKLRCLRLNSALVPAYNSPNAELVEASALPENATEIGNLYFKVSNEGILTPGSPEEHTLVEKTAIYPDALFVFEQIESDL